MSEFDFVLVCQCVCACLFLCLFVSEFDFVSVCQCLVPCSFETGSMEVDDQQLLVFRVLFSCLIKIYSKFVLILLYELHLIQLFRN